MKTLSIDVPDTLDFSLGCPADSELQRLLRTLLAVKLFESGRCTSGQAAVVAGLSRKAFLLELPKHGVPSALGGTDEIDAESSPLHE